jgi:hypothetical protein
MIEPESYESLILKLMQGVTRASLKIQIVKKNLEAISVYLISD